MRTVPDSPFRPRSWSPPAHHTMLDLQGVQTASTGALLERLATLRELPDRSQLQLVAEIGTRLERGHHLDNAKSQQGKPTGLLH